MKVIKRNGVEVDFTPEKIKNAISSANEEVNIMDQLTVREIEMIAIGLTNTFKFMNRSVSVEEIQDAVERRLMLSRSPEVARKYIRYRYDREKARKGNTTDDTVLTLIECNNEEIKQENSNKNSTIIPTQRDYIAGEVNKDLTRRKLLSKKIVNAHDKGIIHFHDADYFAQHSHNCDLVNIEDMLQNGTVISGTMIEKPHKFSTACNITTQIIAQVASSQYGGQSITLAHLAPFVDETRQKYRKDYGQLLSCMTQDDYYNFIEQLVKEDIVRGVQTIQYQVVTLMTTNGQAPFITVFMDINEVEDGQVRKDLAMIIE